eukprot:1860932-Rhodomonas_salina.1
MVRRAVATQSMVLSQRMVLPERRINPLPEEEVLLPIILRMSYAVPGTGLALSRYYVTPRRCPAPT